MLRPTQGVICYSRKRHISYTCIAIAKEYIQLIELSPTVELCAPLLQIYRQRSARFICDIRGKYYCWSPLLHRILEGWVWGWGRGQSDHLNVDT